MRELMNFLDERLPTRFWDKCMPEPNSGCWLWTGGHNGDGYGVYRVQTERGGVTVRAHQAAYLASHGTVPAGLEIDHLCRVRGCVNPQHLEAVTHAVNMQRSEAAEATRRMYASMTVCRNGIHTLTPQNVRWRFGGTRWQCRECQRAHDRKRRARRAA